MSTAKRMSHAGVVPNVRVSWRTFRPLLRVAAAAVALSSGSAMADFCESDSALIDDNFSGGNLGICEFTSSNSVSFTITPEDALSFPRIDGPPVDRTPGTALVVVMTVIHAGFAVALVNLFLRSRRAPAGVRRAHLAGCLFGGALLVLLQWSALSGLGVMHSMLDGAGR